jgi:hypothetical protein
MSAGTMRRQIRGITDSEWKAFATAVLALFGDDNRSVSVRRFVRETVAKHTGLTPPDDANAPWPELDQLMAELTAAETTTPKDV